MSGNRRPLIAETRDQLGRGCTDILANRWKWHDLQCRYPHWLQIYGALTHWLHLVGSLICAIYNDVNAELVSNQLLTLALLSWP